MAKKEAKPKETIEQEVEETVVAPATVKGIVSDCSRLNIRKKPNAKAEVVTIVAKNSAVTIDTECSTKEWYKVTIAPNTTGYCMKKYVTIVD